MTDGNGNRAHIPVLLREVLDILVPGEKGIYVDATFGAGGYTEAILAASPETAVLAVDRDPLAKAFAEPLGRKYGARFRFIPGRFSGLAALIPEELHGKISGVVFDIGVSSMQIDSGERGFSFRKDGPLDMRMGMSERAAAEVVNTLPEEELADVLFHYGEEKKSRAVARAIVAARREKPIETTQELAAVIHGVLKPRRTDKIDPATRTFQALRIYVNEELTELSAGLEAAARLLAPEGRLAAVTFHSLEDRIVKHFFAEKSGKAGGGSRHLPGAGAAADVPRFRLLTPHPLSATEEEARLNPRARSAKLRAAEKRRLP